MTDFLLDIEDLGCEMSELVKHSMHTSLIKKICIIEEFKQNTLVAVGGVEREIEFCPGFTQGEIVRGQVPATLLGMQED